MQSDYRKILYEILTIIQYLNNKEKFVNEFEELNHMKALSNTIERLPHGVQEQIKLCNNDHHTIKRYIPSALYSEELMRAYAESLKNFIKELFFVITVEQKEQIAKIIAASQ